MLLDSVLYLLCFYLLDVMWSDINFSKNTVGIIIMRVSFSRHAFCRVTERLSMTHEDLASIINHELTVNIGHEKGNNRDHKLFFSSKDKMCFVAIQDRKTGTVVTILPIDYHNNIAWIVSIDAQNIAKRLVGEKVTIIHHQATVPDTIKKFKEAKAIDAKIQIKPSVFKVSGYLAGENGQTIKLVCLGSEPSEPYDYNVEKLIKDKNFIDTLAIRINDKVVATAPNGSIRSIIIRLGQKGEPVFLFIEHGVMTMIEE